MSPKPRKEPQEPSGQLVFVGGPTLPESGELRSIAIRRALEERRTERRQHAEDRLDLMLKSKQLGQEDQAGTAGDRCSCLCSSPVEQGARTSWLDSEPATLRRRMIMPKDWTADCCPTCGGRARPVAGSRAPSPQSPWAGRSNPLLPVNALVDRLKVHELLDFAATTIWPHFRGLDHPANCYQGWVFPMENQLQLYAILWGASYHRDILRITHGAASGESREQLELKALTLQSLKREIANVDRLKSPDGLVMCILWLAANDKHKKITRDLNPFSPPFKNLQALDFCGAQEYHPLHWNMVHNILRRFGGIESIKTYALAWLVSLASLIVAVQSLSKPVYPVMGAHGQRLDLDLQPPSLLFQPHGYHEGPDPAGSGFHELFYLWPPIKHDLIDVFIELGQYAAVLQHLHGNPCSPAILDLLGDSRNLIHHRLLSLPDEHDPVDMILEHDQTPRTEANCRWKLSLDIYHAARLSAILYAVHVTFPLPYSKAPRDILLYCLRPRLHNLHTQNLTSPLLIWCLAVVLTCSMVDEFEGSAPASPESDADSVADGPGMVTYMACLCRDLGVNDRQGLEELVRTFVWADAAATEECWARTWSMIRALL
ncbi:uncharacterized protein DSM5745_03277 [Aspergillus mulundensis]|uniref:Transcription factor domain-containing protein n=1 Tax=Aspergillus mulundensis TaxID=1810919 RepID=A0A3D8SJX4_9EURO|nr:hypothetical protein DSM5745_03277 [Aspergillus mulundensis]RDW86635.1 hypothetical protein DSM5745_03277 [Aspergillus mulundensis]